MNLQRINRSSELMNLEQKNYTQPEKFGRQLEIGTKIIRLVTFVDVPIVSNINFCRTEKGDYVFKAFQAPELSSCPIALPTEQEFVRTKVSPRGFICFCCYEIPKEWIYFLVTGFSREGKNAFVKPIVGGFYELTDLYDKRLENSHFHSSDKDDGWT